MPHDWTRWKRYVTNEHPLLDRFFRWPVIVDGVSIGKHPLVQDAKNQNASGVLTVKHDMPAAFHSTQTGTNIVTAPAQPDIVSQHLATGFEIVDVTDGLDLAPVTKGVRPDAQQICFSTPRETKEGHGLARLRGEIQCFPNARKHVALSNTARGAFINSRP